MFDFFEIYPEAYYMAQIFLAMVLGGMIGWQRAGRGKSAGSRTYALVTAGSTLFTILSIYSFGDDVARVAAGIVTGIGFLGAGTILHKENRVEGLTTAAGLWMAAAIGMAIGADQFILAVLSAVLVLIILMIDERKIRREENCEVIKK